MKELIEYTRRRAIRRRDAAAKQVGREVERLDLGNVSAVAGTGVRRLD